MNARDLRLATRLVELSERLPPLIDHMLAADLTRHQWYAFADNLSATATLCREHALLTIGAGDTGGHS